VDHVAGWFVGLLDHNHKGRGWGSESWVANDDVNIQGMLQDLQKKVL
jgi:hypothetical protein